MKFEFAEKRTKRRRIQGHSSRNVRFDGWKSSRMVNPLRSGAKRGIYHPPRSLRFFYGSERQLLTKEESNA
jgi:hypothetical protein